MKRIVLKIGTKLLTTKHGKLDLNNLRQLCIQVTELLDDGSYEFIIVSSGSIICGSESLNINVQTIPEKQAAAALGQILLMREYHQFFEQKNYKAAQILVTKDGLNNKEKQLVLVPVYNIDDFFDQRCIIQTLIFCRIWHKQVATALFNKVPLGFWMSQTVQRQPHTIQKPYSRPQVEK